MSKQLCLNLAVDHFSYPAKVSCNYDSHDGELLGLSLGQNNLECLGCRVSKGQLITKANSEVFI